jgi:hypothetical protein
MAPVPWEDAVMEHRQATVAVAAVCLDSLKHVTPAAVPDSSECFYFSILEPDGLCVFPAIHEAGIHKWNHLTGTPVLRIYL